MPFTDQQISKWAVDYERELCAKHNLICDRLSLDLTAGIGEYQLPNYITNIRLVIYKGQEIKHKGMQASLITGDTPFSTVGSSPFEYVVNGKGQRVIRFYPTPLETIAAATGDLFSIDADKDALIIEFYRTPSQDNLDIRLPEWCRRYLLKDYICWKAFNNEGPDQDMRAANYYASKLEQNSLYIAMIKDNMFSSYITNFGAGNLDRRVIGRGVMPSNYGTPVIGGY